MKKFKIDKIIFYPGAGILLAMIAYGFFANNSFVSVMNFLYGITTEWFGWLMMLLTGLIVILCFVVAFTPVGDKKVGGRTPRSSTACSPVRHGHLRRNRHRCGVLCSGRTHQLFPQPACMVSRV